VRRARSGPLVLCLNGFPDQARSVRHWMPALATAGFVAPATRRRARRPTAAYDGVTLGEDIVALLDAETAIVFGHDWRAAATWERCPL